MSRIASLGRAFISVHADTSPFAREVRQEMRRLATDLRDDTDRAGRLIGQRMGLRARQGLRQAFGRRPLNLSANLNLNQASVTRTQLQLAQVTRNREVDIRVNRRTLLSSLGTVARLIGLFVLNIVKIFSGLFSLGRQIGQIFGEAFKNVSNALGGAGAAAVTLGAAIVQLAAAFAALAAVIVLLAGLLGVLLALLTALVNTTQLLLTLIPGLAVGLVIGLLPLVLVFTNLGEAIKATAGDLEDFQDAVDELGPQTAGALAGVRELVQFFLGIRELVQESFFGPINQAINDLDNNLGPTFRQGFIEVAGAAGQFAASFIELFNHPMAIPFFTALFELAELGFEEIGESVINLVAAFANLIDESIPNLRRAVDAIADTIQGWADSINDFANDPNFQETIEGWETSFRAIRDLLDETVRLVGNLIEGFEEDGIPVLEDFTELLEGINEFLESEQGKNFFDGMRVSATIFLALLEMTLIPLILMITLLGIISNILDQGIFETLKEINELLGPAGLLSPLPFIIGLSENWRDIVRNIKGWWDGIVEDIRELVEIISGGGIPFSRTLRSIFRGIATFAGWIRTRISHTIGFARTLLSPLRTIRTIARTIASFARTFRDALSGAAFWAGQIRDRINAISPPGGSAGGAIGAALAGAFNRFFQDGGIVTRPTRAILGEAGPEVVIPLSRPDRARELLSVSGLSNLIRGGDGASASGVGVGAPAIRLEFISDGTAGGDAILDILRRSVRIRGGNVQTVIGAGGR